ncbi:MAG: hypothetical protein AAFY10_02700, partial [Pseudomonadota bacterium]
MNALRDPFAQVHPLFWPVLWLSLRAFVRWSGKMMKEGHGFAGLSLELTWYGIIRVHALDLSKAGKGFRRHMAGAAREDGWDVLHRASGRIETLLANGTADACAGRGPWTKLSTCAFPAANRPWIPACAGICGDNGTSPKQGTGPPSAPAPLPYAGRGAAPPLPAIPT